MPRARALLVPLLGAACLGAAVIVLVIFATGGFDSGDEAPVTTPAASDAEDPGVPAVRGGAPDWAALYAKRVDGVVTVFVERPGEGVQASGAGFVADATRGLIITNSHVVTSSDDADEPGQVQQYGPVYVQRADGARATASIVGYDLFDDIAVLRYDPSSLRMPAVPLGNSATMRVGDPVGAIGAPLGHVESFSAGVVSQIGSQIIAPASVCFRTTDAIQTDASINPGNSGGPLFNAAGRVIGVNSQIESSTGGRGGSGVAFAVPINAARRSLREIAATGRVRYAWLGVGAITVTPDIAAALHLKTTSGAQVSFVDPRSAANAAGITPGAETSALAGRTVHTNGDVIVAFDGKPVRTLSDLQHAVAAKRPGDRVSVEWWHGSTRHEKSIVLGERSPTDPDVCKATAVP